MAGDWQVWLHVEGREDDSDAYSDVDLPFPATAQFDTEEEAVAFASRLHDLGTELAESEAS